MNLSNLTPQELYYPHERYNIVYVDPPWEYRNAMSNNPALGGITYNVLSDDVMARMGESVRAVVDTRSCALLMWATWPKMESAFRLIRAWGFEYVTCAFTWVKLNRNGSLTKREKDVILRGGVYSGLGSWTNQNTENLLFARMGRPIRHNKSVKQVVFSPVGQHSAKPLEVYDRIVQVFGDRPRLEMFARTRAEGWDATGYDYDGLDVEEFLYAKRERIDSAAEAVLER